MPGPCFLSLEQVLRIHTSIVEAYGGAVGVADMGLLQAAASTTPAPPPPLPLPFPPPLPPPACPNDR